LSEKQDSGDKYRVKRSRSHVFADDVDGDEYNGDDEEEEEEEEDDDVDNKNETSYYTADEIVVRGYGSAVNSGGPGRPKKSEAHRTEYKRIWALRKRKPPAKGEIVRPKKKRKS